MFKLFNPIYHGFKKKDLKKSPRKEKKDFGFKDFGFRGAGGLQRACLLPVLGPGGGTQAPGAGTSPGLYFSVRKRNRGAGNAPGGKYGRGGLHCRRGFDKGLQSRAAPGWMAGRSLGLKTPAIELGAGSARFSVVRPGAAIRAGGNCLPGDSEKNNRGVIRYLKPCNPAALLWAIRKCRVGRGMDFTPGAAL